MSPIDDRPTRRELMVAGAGAAAAATLLDAAAAQAARTHKNASHDHVQALKSGQAHFDARRIERLLRVELLLLFSYQHVLGSSLLGPEKRQALEPLQAHEQAHIRALTARLTVLGGSPPAPPASAQAANRDLAHRKVKERLGQLTGTHDALQLLVAVERVVVGAYFVALIKLSDPSLVLLVAQMMASDAQHEALIGELMYPGNAQKAVPFGLVQGVQ